MPADLLDGFVAHRGVDNPSFSISVEAFHITSERTRSRGIVRAIENDIGIRRNVFQASRPTRLGDALRRKAELVQRQRGRYRIVDLMFAR